MLRSFTPLLVGLGLVLGGCDAVREAEVRTAGALLVEAGFKVLPADTPERVKTLEKIPPNTISIVTRKGEKFWVYPDPTYCGCVLAGTKSQYDEYERLVAAEERVRQALAGADDGPAPSDWGMWGPWR